MNRAVFLDRDGVVNKPIFRRGVATPPWRLEELKLFPSVRSAVRLLRQELGLPVIVVSNQPDVARGDLPLEELQRINDYLRRLVEFDDILVCVHDDHDGCVCRKPRPGLLCAAAERWGIDLIRSFLVGDSWKDIEAGRRAGCTTIVIRRPYNTEVNADYEASDLREAALAIARLTGGHHEDFRGFRQP